MRIEAFTAARDWADSTANEDALVVLSGRAYAVIDGVTDRTGMRLDGMLSGRFAAQLASRELERSLDETMIAEPLRAVEHLTDVFAELYATKGTAAAAAADWGTRIACTLALATTDAATLRVVLVGDSGIRLNGTRVECIEKDIDIITSTLRACAWRLAATRVADADARERAARAVTLHGTAQEPARLPPPLKGEDLPALHAVALAACRMQLPALPVSAIEPLLAAGIVRGQGKHQNNAKSILGYSCLDGFLIPRELMQRFDLPLAEVASLELFTDGYFRPGEGVGVAAWEAAFAEVERIDPAKVLDYPSPKGSTSKTWADDRTYVAVTF